MNFCKQLEEKLKEISNPNEAKKMEKYLKYNFPFFGIKTNERRQIFKLIYDQNQLEIKANYRNIAMELLTKKEREFHLCAVDLLVKELKNNYILSDIDLIEKCIKTNSWWDSVDVFAKYLLGGYLQKFPNEINATIERFSSQNDMWLERSTIIFQLSYKEKTDFDLLKAICENHKDSNAFFIQKAIGWALRDYSRFNPIQVKNYVENTNLKPLSQREALRLLN